jgi:hypothetical protein
MDVHEGAYPHLFIGPLEFADPTLLISADAQSLRWLADRIESRQLTSLRQGHPTFVVSARSITLIPVDTGGRLDERRMQYEWRIDEDQARDFVERLRVLAQSPRPAHAYLDTESSLQIVASIGEYDLNRLRCSTS